MALQRTFCKVMLSWNPQNWYAYRKNLVWTRTGLHFCYAFPLTLMFYHLLPICLILWPLCQCLHPFPFFVCLQTATKIVEIKWYWTYYAKLNKKKNKKTFDDHSQFLKTKTFISNAILKVLTRFTKLILSLKGMCDSKILK